MTEGTKVMVMTRAAAAEMALSVQDILWCNTNACVMSQCKLVWELEQRSKIM